LFVGRRESPAGIAFFGQHIQQENVRVVFDPQGAPDPVRQSFYSAVGRAPTQQVADVNVSLFLNRAGIQAVQEDTFLTGKAAFLPQSVRVRQGYAGGGQLPWSERSNIQPGAAEPFGNNFSVQPIAPQYGDARTIRANGLSYQLRRFV
jgi:hypothetical protein